MMQAMLDRHPSRGALDPHGPAHDEQSPVRVGAREIHQQVSGIPGVGPVVGIQGTGCADLGNVIDRPRLFAQIAHERP